MERLTYRSDYSDMIWFVDHENSERRLEPCEMNSHQIRIALQKLEEYESVEVDSYRQGAEDMEKAKQIIIDGLLNRIEELEKKHINRPIELYAIEDCIRGNIIFNARGGCYRDISDANRKVRRLMKEKGGTFRVVTYRLQ